MQREIVIPTIAELTLVAFMPWTACVCSAPAELFCGCCEDLWLLPPYVRGVIKEVQATLPRRLRVSPLPLHAFEACHSQCRIVVVLLLSSFVVALG